MRRSWLWAAAALAGTLLSAPALAQETPADTTRQGPEVRPSEPIPIDTLGFGMAAADTIPVLARLFRESDAAERLAAVPSEDRLPRNPRNAAIRAVLIPGWGQVYTGHPLRAVFYAAGEVGFFLLGYQKQQDVLDTRQEIDDARAVFFADTTLPSDPDARESLFLQSPAAVQLFGDLEFHRERRNDWYAYAGASLLFATIDAYVAAQLDPVDVGADVAERRAWLGLRFSTGGPPRGRR
jgi:hypothetical protein